MVTMYWKYQNERIYPHFNAPIADCAAIRKKAMNLFLLYWKQISLAVAGLILLAYVSLLRHENNSLQRDNESLKVTIASISALGKAQDEKSDRIEEGSRKAAEIITSQYQTDLQKVKDYYAKNPVVKFKPNGMCNNSTSNRTEQVPTTDTSPSRIDERAADNVPADTDTKRDCAITTLMLVKLQEFEKQQQEIK